jgi:hypothetical protein
MVQTRHMKQNNITSEDKTAASVLISLKSDHNMSVEGDGQKGNSELKKVKEELTNLKLIKEYTTKYNTLKMIVDIYTRELDSMEIKITTLLSIVN